MSVWDKETPLGVDSVSTVDDRIRELKKALEEALQGQASEGDEAIFPGDAPSTAPVYRYRGLKGATGSRPASGQYGLYFDSTRNVLQRDNGATWDDIATVIPAGTVMGFFQATVPTGWTLVTTQNDKVLRVVSGTGGGSGGTIATSTGLSHSHNISTHSGHTHSLDKLGGTQVAIGSGTFSGLALTDGAHSHNAGDSLSVLAYADIILGSKD